MNHHSRLLAPATKDIGDGTTWNLSYISENFPNSDQYADHGIAQPDIDESEKQKRFEILLVL